MSTPVEVAIAILYQDGKFLCQLRDDIPTILYPGHWALFGGHLESGETPDSAVRRELLEEISYAPAVVKPVGTVGDDRVIRHIYHGKLEVALEQLILAEGADFDLLTPVDIERGEHYSHQLQQVRPLGIPHRTILLDFIATCTDWKA